MKRFLSILQSSSIQTTILWLSLVWFLLLQVAVYGKDYTRPFREQYLYTLYYHSQWVVPDSKQSIGDDGLYQVAGHQLIQKHNFFEINPEVPPLGKYYYGASIFLFGNAEIGALLLFLISIVLFYILVRQFINNPLLQVFAVLFFVTDPLLFYQSRVSMLDLPQLVVLLGHILTVLKIVHSKKTKQSSLLPVIFAGLTLGMFMSLKIGFLGIVIMIADAIVLWRINKIRYFFVLLALTGLTYTSTYLMYFVQGHSIVEFLQAQKWMLNFYLSSPVEPVFGTVFTTILFGRIIGWNQDAAWASVPEWSISWSIFFSGFMVSLIYSAKTKGLQKTDLLYLLLLSAGLSIAYIVLPFFTRYLVLLIPLLILCTFSFLQKPFFHTRLVLVGLFILFTIHYYMFWY